MGTETVIRVLVVDDHEVVRRGLHAFLDGEPDLEVVADAGGGEEALEALARLDSDGQRPDVVLMDLQMAPMDGIETTRRILDRYPGVEVVALTSFGEKERVRGALDSGASGYLLKDSEPAEIAAAVRSAHRGELQLDPAVTRPLFTDMKNDGGNDLTSLLTGRELQVLRLVGAGKANKEIAAALVISERTARTHVSNVLRKVGVSSRTQAAVLAVREGLVAPPEAAGDSHPLR
ncbi:MAG TPA: response regulator transcription factor [Gaiellaceae bacterium]|jgi:DNA-binding NarL/FixJ family response regulator|nr:response regulator transcription factor [Gaiellaceae bacterium]